MAGAFGIVFTISKLTNDEADAVVIVAYVVPMGLLLAMAWGVLYGLSAVVRSTRIIGAVPRLNFIEDEDD